MKILKTVKIGNFEEKTKAGDSCRYNIIRIREVYYYLKLV